jgi:hypothetical protein
VLLSKFGFSQNNFVENDLSNQYSVKFVVAKCEDNTCFGKGIITISSKENFNIIQTIYSEDLYFYTEEGSTNRIKKTSTYKEEDGTIVSYQEDLPVAFGDYNFDGFEDVAVRNGNNSSYNESSFDIYIYNVNTKQFLLSKELTELASTNLGMFRIDKVNKHIITFQKSGCCSHTTNEYFFFDKGLKLIKEKFEDSLDDPDYVTVTENNLINDRWEIKTEKYKTADYYEKSQKGINEEISTGLTVKEDSDINIHNTSGIDKQPEFPGGIEKFYKFLSKNYQTPKSEGLRGKVYVSFVIEKDGSLTDIKVIRDIGYGTGNEAIRVLSICPKWIPGEQEGHKVRVMYSISINVQSSE